ncbi:MAG: (d)CMP kinase [Bacteroidota bacterium]
MQLKKNIIVAIDGHSSCGKSTLAKIIAGNLGYGYIDSGAMYRAATLFYIQKNLLNEPIDEEKLIEALPQISIKFKYNLDKQRNETFLNGEMVEDVIRTIPVSNKVSEVSRIPEIRQHMVALQQKMGENKGIVMDGRDIGTVVFPDAEVKIFLTASPEVRAQRRYDELKQKGGPVRYDEVLANVNHRDNIDENREASPLRKADDALLLDNSNMTFEEEWEWVKALIEKKGLKK